MVTFYDIYKSAYGQEASDIHLVFGKPVQLRVHGQLKDYDGEVLTDERIQQFAGQIVTAQARQRFEAVRDADFSYQFASHERLRVNMHVSMGHVVVIARIIKAEIPSFQTIRLGSVEEMLTKLNFGLILVCGPTGSGKSTTLASMIDRINAERTCKIITVEDPIEYVFDQKKSTVEQREIGIDAPTFEAALRTVFRQDPNVIMVGEMRDKETAEQTLRIAETGHLVFSTLHTSSAPATILRIVDIFQPHEQRQVKVQLAENLRAVIFQQLIASTDGKRIAAREILINTKAVANIIRTGNFEQLESVLQMSSEEGMITMEKSLDRLYADGLIGEEMFKKRREQALTGYSFY